MLYLPRAGHCCFKAAILCYIPATLNATILISATFPKCIPWVSAYLCIVSINP